MNASIETIKETAIALFNSDAPESDIAFHLALTMLEEKIPENEFVAFCESIA